MFDSIHNVGEFLSDHWLASVFPGQLRTLTKEWAERDAHGKSSPLRGLAAASGPFARAKGRLPEMRGDTKAHVSRARAVADAAELVEAAGVLHELLLTAVGFDVKRQELTTEHGGMELAVPLIVRAQSHSGEALHILEAFPAASEDDLFDRDGAGRLLRPLRVIRSEENVQEVIAVTEALSTLFLSATPPRYAMVVAGGWLLLTDAARWSEGRYLVFDADTALARRQETATGELAWHAGLWSADVLLPAGDEPASRLDSYLDESVKHAVGVSKDLREGLRESVEILANEVVAQRRAQGLPVEDLPELPRELVAQSLRFLYRILFLLYAEARPELGVLPVGAPEYGAGYGLDRLRDLLQVKLTSPAMRDGRHLHESLKLLFGLVNDGHRYRNGAGDDRADDGLRFEPLKSDLFDPGHAPLVDSLPLRNEALQQILALLLLSKERKGRDRGFVSYAQLGINQLGAVYEGLMSYSGFFAERNMIELAKDGEPDKGSWFVPAERAGEYDEKHLVMRVDPVTGHRRKITHQKGSFVFRLSGRDRQRSASYYTPEVLTRCVVKHSLAELLPDDSAGWDAQRVLDLTICEPALGSGAFLNEAINQLARKYLERRQEELKTSIPPDQYADELQKVKAHLALHRCYGVDLNRTAVELAEVSLWLNVMHPGLQGPWFGLHLRRGNSLVGTRRATYDFTALGKAKQSWLKTPPTDRHLAEGDIEFGEIHHFLLPAHGWGAVAETKQAKELAKDAADALKSWSKEIKRKPATGQLSRLRALARRVERLWELTIRRLEISEREIARHIDVWQAERLPETAGAVSRQEVESALNDPERPYQRLRLVMDAWCALWFWPLNSDAPPPNLNEWIATLEDLVGTEPKAAPKAKGDRLGLFGEIESFADLQDADDNERIMHQMKPVLQTMLARPWLGVVREIAAREGFFHWELDYAHIFKNGGFDLQVGNPPWVRPTWEDDTTLAEFDPFFKLEDRIPETSFRERRRLILASRSRTIEYLRDATIWSGLLESLESAVDHPILSGLRPNLYTSFIERAWRSRSDGGIVSLLHPESHFSNPDGGAFREMVYRRLRRHFQFGNNLLIFEEIDNNIIFGLSVYGSAGSIDFINISNILHPAILDESLALRSASDTWPARSERGALEREVSMLNADSSSQDLKPEWDFFISYSSVDQMWAEWIAWHLEESGFQVLIQAWDFIPGSNWASKMQQGVARSARTIALLSKAYLESAYSQVEWQAVLAADPQGLARRLIPVRIEDCPRPGLLGQIVSFDLFGLAEDAASARLADQIAVLIQGRAKPVGPPIFPHSFSPSMPRSTLPSAEPSFPDCMPQKKSIDEVPGIQFKAGGWDLRSHSSRVVRIDESTLETWALLFDESNTPGARARLLRPFTSHHLSAIERMAVTPIRMVDIGYNWTRGWHERDAKTAGDILWSTSLPESWVDLIIQGPHFTVATPLAMQPNIPCKSNKDYEQFDLEILPPTIIPRANYTRTGNGNTGSGLAHWNGIPYTDYWRLVWRNMTQPGLARSLHAALIPPGPTHVHTVHTLAMASDRYTALAAGLWASIPFDYLIKISGMSKVNTETVDRFPAPLDHVASKRLLLRTLRLNCLTRDYAPLWEKLYEADFTEDGWTPPFADRPTLGVSELEWTMSTPLRADFDRRAALVEIDALAALMLGLTAEQLCLMFRVQFAVLRRYEYATYFDTQGRKIAKDHHAMGVKQQKDDYKILHAWVADRGLECEAPPELADRYRGPFRKPDREAEMRAAYAEFARRLGLDPETGVELTGQAGGAVERGGA